RLPRGGPRAAPAQPARGCRAGRPAVRRAAARGGTRAAGDRPAGQHARRARPAEGRPGLGAVRRARFRAAGRREGTGGPGARPPAGRARPPDACRACRRGPRKRRAAAVTRLMRPTSRIFGVLVLGALLYLAGGDYEVPWLLLLGFVLWALIPLSWIYARRNARRIEGSVQLTGAGAGPGSPAALLPVRAIP